MELAAHFERGHDYPRAVHYYRQAGQNALKGSAPREAVSHFTKALELLATFPDTADRAQQELGLRMPLGLALITTRGYAAPEVEAAFTRAHELCQQVGETPQLFPVLRGLYAFYNTRAQFQRARELGEQCLALAQRQQGAALLVEAHYALGITLFFLGEYASSREHLEQGIAVYDPQQYRSGTYLYGQDPRVGCLTYLAPILWYLGYPDQALEKSREALTLAHELSHPFSLAFALYLAAGFRQNLRDAQAAQELAEAAIALSNEKGFALLLATGTMVQGWALAEQGQGEEGLTQMHRGLTDYRATGAELGWPLFLARLTEVYEKVGQREEGLSLLTEALATVNKTGGRTYEAELYRLRGELTLAQSKVQGLASSVQKGAEEDFLQAIEVARRQQAKSLELRAVMSLSRLWQQQGKEKEARQVLAEIYGWFTEGFDTADLKEAKALLQELT